jgi:hypothetical protein
MEAYREEQGVPSGHLVTRSQKHRMKSGILEQHRAAIIMPFEKRAFSSQVGC